MLILIYTLLYIVSFLVLEIKQYYLVGILYILVAVRAFSGLRINPFYFIDFFYRKFTKNNMLELLAVSLAILFYYVINGYIYSFPEIITYPFMTIFFYSTCFIDVEEVLMKKGKSDMESKV
ncbi:hypothetical protein BKP37_09165 [Anaerobacillus alkalilacustris]|uniref:Uncharacterized protein n=1 Tax=Anaerobacillus alkalilacustris TaxID=393763 RepID=A0A1S2LQL3_9BACI|nr:hypothetical protein [Anaerobacillus alkalilacustris]OIJ13977.1 hypothetical protein BKP37_09165 [Anaerobacillus alkalilacustris]